ncbi:MAG: hypothetical protein U1B30_02140 [Pseudomonadota bacterium]|nr:hypothetical protein [Pseudomonadota bacterium]
MEYNTANYLFLYRSGSRTGDRKPQLKAVNNKTIDKSPKPADADSQEQI